MSLQEVDRYAVVQQVVQRRMRQSDAALWLDVSVRQIKRLARAVRQEGAQGAVSKRRELPSNRRTDAAQRERFVGLVRERYSDFGPTLRAPPRARALQDPELPVPGAPAGGGHAGQPAALRAAQPSDQTRRASGRLRGVAAQQPGAALPHV